MYTVNEFKVPSSDGIHTLSGKIYRPKGEIRGLFHVVHGMTEYIDRYEPLFAFMANAGYVTFGYDNLGHGMTAEDYSELGFIAHKDGHKKLVRDVNVFEEAVKKEYPNLPLFLMGHSMGSFIVRIAANEKTDLKGLIICGTGGPNPASPAGLLITDILRKIYGEKHVSPLVEKIAFGTYNRRFEGLSKYDWLTKDRTIITKYEHDKYCTFHFTVSAMHDLVKLNTDANRKDWFKNYPKDLPTLIVSGEDDPVGNYGKGVKTVYNNLKKASVSDVSLRIYENCRHEIQNDTCKDEMFNELLNFLNKNT